MQVTAPSCLMGGCHNNTGGTAETAVIDHAVSCNMQTVCCGEAYVWRCLVAEENTVCVALPGYIHCRQHCSYIQAQYCMQALHRVSHPVWCTCSAFAGSNSNVLTQHRLAGVSLLCLS